MLGLVAWMAVLSGPVPAQAASRKILKVLPQYLDLQGRHTLSPSLYERDAYQVVLRDHPEQRSGLRFMISWRSPESTQPYRLRVELRGSKDDTPTKMTLEEETQNKRGGREWTEIRLTGETYEELGELLAWRATLWKDDELLSEDKSFLW